MKKIFTLICLSSCCLISSLKAQTTLLSPTVNNGGFESGSTGWTIVNGNGPSAQTNKWHIGNTSSCTGSNGAYIGTGSNNNNYNNGSASVSHLYRDITFPAGQTQITLSFDYKGNGEGSYDYLTVHVVPTTTNPVAGTALTTGQVGASEYGMVGTTCSSSSSINLSGTYAGTTQRLVFTWRNDGVIGTNPAITIDNVTLITQVSAPPVNDNCSSATSLTVGASCSPTSGNLLNATASTPASPCTATADDDVWYSFVAAQASQTITVTPSASLDAVVQLLTGSCASMTSISCQNAAFTGGVEQWSATGLTPGQTYYLRIYSSGSAVPSTTGFTVCVTNPPSCPTGLGTGVVNVPSLPYSYGSGTTCGMGNDITSTNSTVCGATYYYNGEDMVWIFTPTATGQVTINLTSTGSYTGLMLYQGCPLNGQGGTCIANLQDYTGSKSLIACVTAGVTYYLVLDSWPSPTCNAFSNLTISAPGSSSCATALGTGVVNVPSLPYSSPGRTTCGKVDDLTSTTTPVCGSTSYLTGEDEVFVFTPATSGSITISITSTGSYTGMMLYQGCPVNTCSGPAPTCVAYEQSYTGSKSMCANVVAGQTYYLIIDSWASPTCNPYDITISAPSGSVAGPTCSNPVIISSLPYSATGQSTACMGNDYTNASTGSCGSLYESGEDKVYRYVATGPECLSISLSNASTTSIGFQVYNGCPGSAGTTCVGSYGGSNPLNGSIVLPGAGTYYIIVDTWASPNNASYDIAITSFGSGPANDLPCNATPLTLGASMAGDNSCSGGAGEPGAPTCWYAGNLNTVWYSAVCPASGELRIMTSLGTLYDSQIQLYSGTCSSLTAVTGGCNDNATICTSGTSLYSLLTVTGLVPGATYYIRIDGYSNYTGTFDVTVSDGSLPAPPTVQDCSGAISICSAAPMVQTVSYFGCGSTNDIPPSGTYGNPSTNPNSSNSGCLLAGERNSLWYRIDVSSNGVLAWTLSNPASSIYDWTLYNITAPNSCSNIASNTLAPVRCNWNSGSNAVGTGMQSPVPPGGIAGNFEAPLNVTAGQSYVLCITNYSGTTGGYTIDFSNSTNGFQQGSTITWTGSSSTAWATAANWGGCAPPACTQNAVITAASNQPVITTNSTVKDLTINAGATLTINPGVTLTVCGNLTNNGTLIASPTSTILFNNGAVTHTLNGNLTGTNKLGNLTITKTGGSVIANNPIDIGGSFTTSNATSVFNSNGQYIRLAGNFNNAAGATTYTNTAGGTLEFNGSSAQNYSPGGTLTLNNVIMNHTGPGVTLIGNNMMIGTAGTLTLTSGKIITNVPVTLEVQVNNTAPSAVTAGNVNSFVQGYLRRKLQAAGGSYDFPVGHATKGYQRANVNFTTATNINNLLASFSTYSTTPAALNQSECSVTYNMPALDNGRWTINAYDASNNQIAGTGTYTMTLYNLAGSYTNSIGASGWTVMKDPGTGWGLNGNCAASTVNQVIRTGMSGFSNFGTAQSTSPLPIELLSFTGKSLGTRNQLDWVTATEINNDYFTVERSSNGIDFTEASKVDGAGNSNAVHSYSTIDNDPYPGLTYYRLKQTDFDGKFSYSPLIAVENQMDKIMVDNIHPNPTNGDLNFDFISPIKGVVEVKMFDAYGKLIFEETMSVDEGKTPLTTHMGHLAQGIYTLRVVFEEGKYSSVSRITKY